MNDRTEGMSAFARTFRYETVMMHRDQHKDVAKAVRIWGTPYWCLVCGFSPRAPKRDVG